VARRPPRGRLREVEGITTEAYREQVPDWTLWTHDAPGGETLADVGARVDRVIAEAVAVPGDGDVLCVAHGHVLRVLAARWIGLDPAAGAHLALGTGAICVLGFERDTRVTWRLERDRRLGAHVLPGPPGGRSARAAAASGPPARAASVSSCSICALTLRRSPPPSAPGRVEPGIDAQQVALALGP
jgi:hypothetical protein